MLTFLETIMTQSEAVSLQDFWVYQAINGNLNDSRWSEKRGSGVLAYEVVMQVGIVLRKNVALGIEEDCWRLIYPRALEKESSSSDTFGAFLCKFFPQLRSIFNKLCSSDVAGQSLENLVIKYCAHRMEPPLCQVPVYEASTVYQTVGTLNEPCGDILAR